MLSENLALVQTVDVFTPIVDDPVAYGRIAAANALSDIYAMGGTPTTALNIVCFPTERMELEILSDILRGGLEKLQEAGVVLLGGHTVQDEEIKYGVAVTGTVDPREMVTHSGCRPGDLLVLTKPVGTGIVSTGIRQELATEEEIGAAVHSMSTLNRAAAQAMLAAGAHACTDVTGYGLLGHAQSMAQASGVALEIAAEAVPLLPGALRLAAKDCVPGGSRSNVGFYGTHVTFADELPEELAILLFDAQTSGGLLIAVPPDNAQKLLDDLARSCPTTCATVGRVVEGPAGTIVVRRRL